MEGKAVAESLPFRTTTITTEVTAIIMASGGAASGLGALSGVFYVTEFILRQLCERSLLLLIVGVGKAWRSQAIALRIHRTVQ